MCYKYNIIDLFTKLKNGSSHYLSIREFSFLIDKLKLNSSMIKEYISFTPFYEHKDFMMEVDERILYIERSNKTTDIDKKKFYEEEIIKEKGYEAYNIDIEKRIFLVQKKDNDSFIKSLDAMLSYLDVLIPYILKRLKMEYNFIENDLLYGNICFEVHYR